jgi:hypothetical protein
MKSSIIALTLAAAAGTAAAQPQPPPTGPQQPPPVVVDPTAPEPPPPPPQPQVRAPEPMRPAEPEADSARPSELSIAIGLGYALPTSLQTPNITSVRVRFATGIELEPQLVLASSSTDVDTGMSATDKSNELGIGALARFPLVRHGRVDLSICGSLALDRASTSPEEPNMDVTVSSFSANYGLAVAAWITRHWQISLTAMNPLLATTKRDADNDVGNTVTTTTTFGLIFDPNVALMVHLYH